LGEGMSRCVRREVRNDAKQSEAQRGIAATTRQGSNWCWLSRSVQEHRLAVDLADQRPVALLVIEGVDVDRLVPCSMVSIGT
jgi:hypothetical protein